MTVVAVRLFAALRDAAGEARTTVDAATVDDALARLRDRYGEAFARRLEVATVLVDGDQVEPTSTTPLRDGAELVLLPPFAGG